MNSIESFLAKTDAAFGGWFGGSVTYVRGVERLTLSATFGRTELQVADTLGSVRTEHTERDFLVTAASLILGGAVAEPRPGDRIEEAVDGTTYTYEVMVPEGQERAFQYDVSRALLRIHTKRVSIY